MFYTRYGSIILLIALLGLPVVVRGVIGAAGTMNNEFRQWAPSDRPYARDYDQFVADFQANDLVIVSWDDCTLDDPRLGQLAEGLVGNARPKNGPSRFARIDTGPELIAQMTAEPLELSDAEARRRLRGFLIGPDLNTTGAVVVLSEEGARDRVAAVREIYEVAERECGLRPEQLYLGGPASDQVALDHASRRSLYVLTAGAAIFACLIAWACLRQWAVTLIVLAVASYAAAASVALLYYTGEMVTLMMTASPILVFVLGISGAIHLIHYYRDAYAECAPEFAAAGAIRLGWMPCTLAAVTTAIGMFSLTASALGPVRAFGLYSALGVLMSLAALLLLLPSALSRWPPSVPEIQNGSHRRDDHGFTQRLSAGIERRHRLLSVGCLGLMLLAGVGIMRIETSLTLTSQFDKRSRIIRDYRWLEQHLGPVVPVEVIVRFAPECPLDALDRLRLVHHVEQTLMDEPLIGGTLSGATYCPADAIESSDSSILRRRLSVRRVERSYDQLISLGLLRVDSAGQKWRISGRVKVFRDIEYGPIVDRIGRQVDRALSGEHAEDAAAISVTCTGLMPLLSRTSRRLLEDLFRSFVAAFVVIAVVMAVALRSPLAAAVAMIPNLFPALMVFGGLSWMRVPIDNGTMMTAAVALGIAVDDTMHFLTWYRRATFAGLSNVQAVAQAYRCCGVAMIQTTTICGLSMLPYMFSEYLPAQRFGLLIAALLTAALIGDLFFLPALIFGRLGRHLARKKIEEEA